MQSTSHKTANFKKQGNYIHILNEKGEILYWNPGHQGIRYYNIKLLIFDALNCQFKISFHTNFAVFWVETCDICWVDFD